MARALRPISHEDRLSLVDHLDELRKRLIICVVTIIAAFLFCFWQNDAILKIITKPVRTTQNLDKGAKKSNDPLEQAARFQREQGEALKVIAPALAQTGRSLQSLAGEDNVSAAQQLQLRRSAMALALASKQVAQAAAAVPANTQRNLVTLGVTEPFTVTMTIAFYAALLIAMPLLLFQLYAFILPAFSPAERRTALPLMLMVPVLFILGVVFGYFVVLTRAVDFLQNFNDDDFDILLQAKDYAKFAIFFVAAIGMLFQIPVGVLAVTRLGIFTPQQLAKNRGYVILVIAIVAAVATPTPDPITMTLAMGPLIVLFELSILLARWLERIKPSTSRFDSDEDEDDEDEDEDAADALGEDDDDEDMELPYIAGLEDYDDDDPLDIPDQLPDPQPEIESKKD